MKSAIIFIKTKKELELAKAKILGSNLIEYTVFELKKLDLDAIYLIGAGDLIVDGATKRNNIDDVIEDLCEEKGKTLLVSPFYPLTGKDEYKLLLSNKDEDGVVMLDEEKRCAIFCLPNNRLKTFEKANFKEFDIEETSAKRLNDFSDLPVFGEELRLRINTRLINRGVNIIDPFATYICKDAMIDKNTTIYPNVYIEGKCSIGKGNTITGGTHIINVIVGDGNTIDSSKVTDTIIHNNCMVGPYAQLRNGVELSDGVRAGNYVEIKNSKIGKETTIAHLAYIGDASVGSYVNIGCGAITINYDGAHKNPTVIKDHAFIGSNANLIAPITIGEYAMVAAGSTVDTDVMDGDMAISRLYQTNKKGYGYRYINKEN